MVLAAALNKHKERWLYTSAEISQDDSIGVLMDKWTEDITARIKTKDGETSETTNNLQPSKEEKRSSGKVFWLLVVFGIVVLLIAAFFIKWKK